MYQNNPNTNQKNPKNQTINHEKSLSFSFISNYNSW